MNTLNVHIVSDLHTEKYPFDNKEVPKDVDLCVIAGDISTYSKADEALNFLNTYQKTLGCPLVFVLGNHDYYGGTVQETLDWWRKELESYSNLYLLDKSDITLNLKNRSVRVLGATLWSYVEKESAFLINDFHAINNFTVETNRQLHEDHKQWLTDKLDMDTDHNLSIVVTHHLPTYKSIHKDFRNCSKAIQSAFVSELSSLIEHSEVDMWIHGHTHRFLDYKMGKDNRTNIVCNPRGIKGEPTGFNPSFIKTI